LQVLIVMHVADPVVILSHGMKPTNVLKDFLHFRIDTFPVRHTYLINPSSMPLSG